MRRSLAGLTVAVLIAGLAVRCMKPSPGVNGLTIAGTATFTHKGVVVQLTATAALDSGAPEDVTTKTTWTTSDATIVAVSSTGAITTVGNGTATITGNYSGKSATLAIVVTLKADVALSSYLERRCNPKRAAIAITLTENSGDVGFTVSSLSVSFVLFGASKAFKSFSAAELAAMFGSTHFTAGQSKVLFYETPYPGGVETEDSNAIIDVSLTDDLGHAVTLTRNDTFDHDGC